LQKLSVVWAKNAKIFAKFIVENIGPRLNYSGQGWQGLQNKLILVYFSKASEWTVLVYNFMAIQYFQSHSWQVLYR
jgi:hypothetical protein